ncbi:MAG: 6-phosphofructokinase [Syntrophales bacterium]|jgi:6-phosphofructokinase 1|nr:6-phosphofructokinase [Syntrophales bacterium]MCK9527188.1 6-phosphofructokinase [Syntrophales bacterium]MDX9921687.1 6-phosphofructokinase [Syntrophales bacterium]
MATVPAVSTDPEHITPAIQRLRSGGLRVGILHSGGPAPGSNRVLAGAAKQFLDRGVQVTGFYNGFEFLQEVDPFKLVPGKHYATLTREVISDVLDVNSFYLKTSRANPGRGITAPDDLKNPTKTEKLVNVLNAFEYLKIGAVISIGGDDTLKTGNYLYEIALLRQENMPDMCFQGSIVHVPKTIDNDYFGIPWTFGFLTASEAAGRSVRGLYDDAKATNCYHVVELMGRRAGWYTAAASIFARGTKAVIPEDYEGRAFVMAHELASDLLEIVLKREKIGKGYGVFCIAEGLADMLPPEDREHIEQDRHGNPRLAEAKIGDRIARELSRLYRETGREKSFKPQLVGYETRQHSPSLYDVLLTSQLGVGAFRLIEQGRKGEMVTVRDNLEIDGIPFSELIEPDSLLVRNRNIDRNGDFYRLLRSLEESFSQD